MAGEVFVIRPENDLPVCQQTSKNGDAIGKFRWHLFYNSNIAEAVYDPAISRHGKDVAISNVSDTAVRLHYASTAPPVLASITLHLRTRLLRERRAA